MSAEGWDPHQTNSAQDMLDSANRYEQLLYTADLLHELQSLALALREPRLAGLISNALAEALMRCSDKNAGSP